MIHALNFLTIEVKRERNPKGTAHDLEKIRGSYFGEKLKYRFGATVLMNEETFAFSVQLLENVAGDLMLSFGDVSEEYYRRLCPATRALHVELARLVDNIVAAEKAGQQTSALKLDLDRAVLRLYAVSETRQAWQEWKLYETTRVPGPRDGCV